MTLAQKRKNLGDKKERGIGEKIRVVSSKSVWKIFLFSFFSIFKNML